MSNKLILITAAICTVAFITGCPQILARKVGGKQTIVLDENRRLLNVTWKDDGNLWILTREREANESPRTYTYEENSIMGVLEGQITIKEK